MEIEGGKGMKEARQVVRGSKESSTDAFGKIYATLLIGKQKIGEGRREKMAEGVVGFDVRGKGKKRQTERPRVKAIVRKIQRNRREVT